MVVVFICLFFNVNTVIFSNAVIFESELLLFVDFTTTKQIAIVYVVTR